MTWLIEQIFSLIGIALLFLLIAAVVAPLESLGWFAGWGGKPPRLSEFLKRDLKQLAEKKQPAQKADAYLLYLSGVGQSTNQLGPDEMDFIHQLEKTLPRAAVITDVFPYSVSNNPLTGERALSPLWRKLNDMQRKNPNSLPALMLINVRNFLQVAVSADPRYGPIYSLGVANEIARSLARHGYLLGSGDPVFLIGYSGGAQVSVGVAPYLMAMLDAPVYVISIGGLISDDPGINQVARLSQNTGSRDPLYKIGDYFYFGRWPFVVNSDWNRAVAAGTVSFRDLGPMAHNGSKHYYDIHATLPDGQTYCDATVSAVVDMVQMAQESASNPKGRANIPSGGQ